MKSFKEFINNDKSTFFNLNEFAEEHTIDKRKLNIIIDNDTLEERTNKEFDGASIGEVLYYVDALVFGELPNVGTLQKFDRSYMIVISSKEKDGMYEIILSQNRGE